MFEECTKVDALVEILGRRLGPPPQVAVVLGSGWKELASDLLENTESLDLRGLDNWMCPKVEGHGADLLIGDLRDTPEGQGKRVLLCGGRVHSYEGYQAAEIVRGVRALVNWGTSHVLLLNAAGSLATDRPAGSLMPFSDHINFGLPNPVRCGENCGHGAQFVNLVDMYDPSWRAALLEQQPQLQEGVYVGMKGPSYETPAEVRMLAAMGGDAVGMSTIPEAIAAHALGAKVMAISLLTNMAAGIEGSNPSHEEVLETATANAQAAADVLRSALLAATV
ncbi:MAG: purine-nucleoside phosphorylase [Planctomycetota bacterium]|jgi:purine-nucleoside phosphorylase|nr:purine-nucleoside phosphorylase [Planctomycetota bacterium]